MLSGRGSLELIQQNFETIPVGYSLNKEWRLVTHRTDRGVHAIGVESSGGNRLELEYKNNTISVVTSDQTMALRHVSTYSRRSTFIVGSPFAEVENIEGSVQFATKDDAWEFHIPSAVDNAALFATYIAEDENCNCRCPINHDMTSDHWRGSDAETACAFVVVIRRPRQ